MLVAVTEPELLTLPLPVLETVDVEVTVELLDGVVEPVPLTDGETVDVCVADTVLVGLSVGVPVPVYDGVTLAVPLGDCDCVTVLVALVLGVTEAVALTDAVTLTV